MTDINTKYVRINADGSSEMVTETRSPRNVSEALLERCGQNVVRTVKRAFLDQDGDFVSVIMTGAETYTVKRLSQIKLLSHYTLNEGFLTPVFKAKDDTQAIGMLAAAPVWATGAITLAFATRIHFGNGTPHTMPDQACYLIAFDVEKRAWRLPLPNLFNDCALCMGSFNGRGATVKEAFDLALTQFNNSDWNSDLIEERQKKASQFFRFKPSEGSVECVPFAGDWTTMCEKVATSVTALIGGLL